MHVIPIPFSYVPIIDVQPTLVVLPLDQQNKTSDTTGGGQTPKRDDTVLRHCATRPSAHVRDHSRLVFPKWFLIGDYWVAKSAFHVLLLLTYDYVIFDHTQIPFATAKIPRKFFLRTIQHSVTDDRTSTKTNKSAYITSRTHFQRGKPSEQLSKAFSPTSCLQSQTSFSKKISYFQVRYCVQCNFLCGP